MVFENLKTFKTHVSVVLRIDRRVVEAKWREMKSCGLVRTQRGHLGAHTPTDLSIRRLLRALALDRLGEMKSPHHRMTHNNPHDYHHAGVILEAHGGVFVRVEISPCDVRSILDFGKFVREDSK